MSGSQSELKIPKVVEVISPSPDRSKVISDVSNFACCESKKHFEALSKENGEMLVQIMELEEKNYQVQDTAQQEIM